MWKKDTLRKNFLRVKQFADQNLGRAEKSEVLSEDLQSVEKRVEQVKHAAQATSKKIAMGLQGTGTDTEKRLKKLPEANLSVTMLECAQILGTDTLMGGLFQMCGECQMTLARELLQCETEVEQNVLNPLQAIVDNDIPYIIKLKKQLSKLTLDMDSARNRWTTAVRQSQVHGTNMASAAAKADQIKDELEEASNRVEQGKDALSTEMFNFVAKEPEHSQKLLELLEAQVRYHRNAMITIEKLLPAMRSQLEQNPNKPVYGVPLSDHLVVTERDIALPIEACVCTLLDLGIEEEGLFRIAGMASKVKKLKSALDATIVDMEEFQNDVHAVAGALKLYLRELPEPLLTFNLYEEFMQCMQLPTDDQKLQALWVVTNKLPPDNYNNFRYLIKFLALLAEKSDVNKMTPSNIAIVIGPNLLWSHGETGPNMLTTGMTSAIVELFVSNADYFFPEEIEFVREVPLVPTPSLKPDAEITVNNHPQKPPSPAVGALVTSAQQVLTSTAPVASTTTSAAPPNPPLSGNTTPPISTTQLTAAPVPDINASPKAPRRANKKPAPRPPDRPLTIAHPPSDKANTFPRQTSSSGEDSQEAVEKYKTLPPARPHGPPPERPHPPGEKPVLPERPKAPSQEKLMVVQGHQRSLSSGAMPNNGRRGSQEGSPPGSPHSDIL